MTLRLRLVAAFAYVLVLVLLALEIPLALSLSRRVDTEVKADAAAQAQLLAAGAAGRLDNREALERLVRGAAADLDGRVIVVDARGRLLADSAGSGLRQDDYGTRPEIARALAGVTAQGTRTSQTLGQDLLFTAVPVVDDGRRVGAVRVTQSLEAVQSRVRRNVIALAGVGVVALALGLALAWLLAGSLARPLRALARTARRVEGGDLDARAELAGSSEQQEVAVAFNDMTDRLGRVLAAQREFVANASHQLRTPLTGLRLRLEAAGLKAGDGAVARELEAAEHEVERLSHLLNALLTLARDGERPSARAPISLAAACERARRRWQARAEQSGHRLVLAGDGDVMARTSDEDVDIVLDNLVENALVYTPEGGAVTLEWGLDGPWAWLAVGDEGPGVGAGEEEHVFGRFVRGAESAGTAGTGLGLAIVRSLAERWGGTASISGGEGTRVEIRLLGQAAPSQAPTLEKVP